MFQCTYSEQLDRSFITFDVSNYQESQTYRRKYIIYVIMSTTASGLKGGLRFSLFSLTVIRQSRVCQLTLSSFLQFFLFYTNVDN